MSQAEFVGEDAFASAARTFSFPIRLRTEPVPEPVAAPVSVAHDTPATAPANNATSASSQSAEPSPANASVPQKDDSEQPRKTSAATDRVLLRQTAINQTQTARAIAHRAVAEMERWNQTIGKQQLHELIQYWTAWRNHIQRILEVDERILAYFSTIAASTTAYAASVTAARKILEPVASGDLLQPSAVVESSVSQRVPPPSSPDDLSNRAGRRKLLTSTADLVGRMAELYSHIAGLLTSTAAVSPGGPGAGAVPGGSEGPSSASAQSTASTAAKGGLKGARPTDLKGTVTWFECECKSVVGLGDALASALEECERTAALAYSDFDRITALYLTSASSTAAKGAAKGGTAAKPGDQWLAELQYRRVCRAFLGVKQLYLIGMAQLFERYRTAEAHRNEILSDSFERYAHFLSNLFQAVSDKPVVDASKRLHTHSDFCASVESSARAAILESRRNALAAGSPSPLTAALEGAAEASAPAGSAPDNTGLVGPLQSGSPYAQYLQSTRIHFTMDALPSVITPVASPLIIRAGVLCKQVGTLMKSWKPHLAVLTRDAHIFLFALEYSRPHATQGGKASAQAQAAAAATAAAVLSEDSEDVATHPEVLAALFPQLSHDWKPPTKSSAAAATAAAAKAGTVPASSSSPSQVVVAAGGKGSAPLPALHRGQLQYAASYAAHVSDLLPHSSSGSSAVTAVAAGAGAAAGGTTGGSNNSGPNGTQTAKDVAEEVRVYLKSCGLSSLLDHIRKHSTGPALSLSLSGTTKVSFAQHADPFMMEVADSKPGWFGASSSKLFLQASSAEDAAEWILAANELITLAAEVA